MENIRYTINKEYLRAYDSEDAKIIKEEEITKEEYEQILKNYP